MSEVVPKQGSSPFSGENRLCAACQETHIDHRMAILSAFISAAYSYTGTETVILAAGEASNPSKQIPRAAKRVMYRIIIFCEYSNCTLLIDARSDPRFDPVRRLGSTHYRHDVSREFSPSCQRRVDRPLLRSVPFNEPRLLGGTDNAASSPWVIAIEKAG